MELGFEPSLKALNETYGASSPMHLLWFFMGFSRPYAIFGGLMEVVPGVLLLFERTETIGALGGAAGMLEGAALNLCYDVPVKLYSTHLFLMSVFLLLPDLKPMWEFFVRRRPAVLQGVWVPRSERRSLRIARRVALGLVCFLCVWVNVLGGYIGIRMAIANAPPPGTYPPTSRGFHWAREEPSNKKRGAAVGTGREDPPQGKTPEKNKGTKGGG